MNEKTKATLTNLDTWKRGLFMILFIIISGAAKFIVTLVAIFQFITLLFKGQTNEAVIPLGQNLSTYLYQITLFLTFKTEEMPFPFLAFPDGAPAPTLHEDNTDAAELKPQSDEEIVDPVHADGKDETEAKKDKKDDSSTI
jgi:hypothetical protein